MALRENSRRSIWFLLMACSTRALKLMRSVFGETTPSNAVPSTLVVRMVSVSNESMPPMLNENDVLPFLIGPSIEYW